MSKSTPVTQLPTFGSSTSQHNFVNEQQKQMVQQAQQTFQLPVNNNDISAPDDDNAIQDMLQSININPSEQQIQQQQHNTLEQPGDVSFADMYHQQASTEMFQQQHQPQQFADPMMMMGGSDSTQSDQPQPQPQPNYNISQKTMFGLEWNTEVKASVLAALLFIGISIAPVDKLIIKYIALDKIPYSDVLIKGLVCGIVMFILLKLM